MPLAKAGQIELSYDRAGDGPPLLLIMGMSGTKHHWGDAVLDDLRKDFEVIVYDHRDCGDSTKTGKPFTIADLAGDAAGLLDALDVDSAHVMGISMGGMVAQELVLAHPEQVRALTLGCTYCGGEGSKLASEETMRRLAEAMMSGDRERAIRAAWEVNVSPAFAAKDDIYATFLARGLRYGVPVPVIMEQMRAITEHDTSTRLGDIKGPTLVIHGTLDQLLPVQNGHMIAGLIPGARLEILDGIGHMFFLEEPAHTAKLVREHALVNA
ncbi:MAG TPA: alpha/beta fold hydrolase [Solirubrobacteraceae bacterium]|jgi:pimeloyl-ACP methyl ester carboxylesterase|nr:alpha/beta fold hydrolase [Solirubrobacteraceae bacterium]